jgi:hypothetical protein
MPSEIFNIPISNDFSYKSEMKKFVLDESRKAFSDYMSRGGRSKKEAQNFISSLYVDVSSKTISLMTKNDLGKKPKQKTTIEMQKDGTMARMKYPRELEKGTWISASIVDRSFVSDLYADCVAYYMELLLLG